LFELTSKGCCVKTKAEIKNLKIVFCAHAIEDVANENLATFDDSYRALAFGV